jgi:4'-phosphopantetheinyl transferase EntD
MTHCAGYAAAAVGPADRVSAIGIDAEPDASLPEGVLEVVATATELERLAHHASAPGAPCWDRLLFSAKEAVYKAWFPLVGEWLDPQEAEVRLQADGGTFTATLLREGLVVDGRPVSCLPGRWVRRHGLLLTAVVLTAD